LARDSAGFRSIVSLICGAFDNSAARAQLETSSVKINTFRVVLFICFHFW
jgi:hypothetical protein